MVSFVAVIFVVVPIAFVIKAVRLALRRTYRDAATFAAIPFVGAGCLVLSYQIGVMIFTHYQLAEYWARIEAARQNGTNIDEQGVHITLGPPLRAEFLQPGMLWDGSKYIIFDASDAIANPDKPNTDCHEHVHALGRHFYRLDSDC